jgi:hypothetical protein
LQNIADLSNIDVVSCTNTLRLVLLDYKQMIKNLVFFSRQMVSTLQEEVIETLSVILLCAAMKLLKRWKLKGTAGQDHG